MKRFVEGTDRSQSVLFPEHLDERSVRPRISYAGGELVISEKQYFDRLKCVWRTRGGSLRQFDSNS
ncbi:hypothetical protein [Janthinobacterium sp. NKUCC06_STL]|uniref:hypothetical protein n=1 Tax=Janthinobacterium sp. NKUCC06_STL TaxID=2842127 RepID=UPI001C5A8629|nr:hypothetical protein [Janthinobacterium sp. NKUCC06_STL]MBW3507612.1 hypothetical protein [Janthinobacterium sp. NKUCC06_STL]